MDTGRSLFAAIVSSVAVAFATALWFTGTSPATAESGGQPAAPPLTALPADQQIQLALSAAPGISAEATIFVLGPQGYVKAREGTNGLSCLVEHELRGKTLEPICYDAEGSATLLQARFFREALRVAGLAEDEIARRIAGAYETGSLKAPRRPGLAYMLSTQATVWDPFNKQIIQVPPHLMFYAPYATRKDIGGFFGVHMPHVLWEGTPEAFIIVVPALLPKILASSPPPVQGGDPLSLPALAAIPAEQQVQLALSAAPPQIAELATVYVLGPKGYRKVRTGTNGFSCLVERQYVSVERQDFETVEPHCYDGEGSATTLQVRLYREDRRAAGAPEEALRQEIDAGYKAGKFTAPRKPGLVYMLSPQTKLYDPYLKKIIQAPPHLMFYAPHATNRDLGGFSGQHMPFIVNEGQPDAYIIVIAAPQPPAGAAGTP